MKNLRKILILFLAIFITGIIGTVISINVSLNKTEELKTVKAKDSIYLLKSLRKNV